MYKEMLSLNFSCSLALCVSLVCQSVESAFQTETISWRARTKTGAECSRRHKEQRTAIPHEAVTWRKGLCERFGNGDPVRNQHVTSQIDAPEMVTTCGRLHTLFPRTMSLPTGFVRNIWRVFFHSSAKGCFEVTGTCDTTKVPATSSLPSPWSFFSPCPAARSALT